MPTKLKPSDFASDQENRWCPGCGDYAILKAVQKCLAELNADKSKTVFVSGIGCSSRLPYYMSTYGFHTIHGRAPAFATGIKITNPELDVWIVTGDGDGLSIGGNHLIHILRRNLDCQILLFNNEVYGLTKGQASPTSRRGTVSPSTPYGSHDRPLSACELALGSGATFVARGVDTSVKQLVPIMIAAKEHKGSSFIEIYQNCVVYNDGVFNSFTERSNIANQQIHVENGKPLIFGENKDKGLIVNNKNSAFDIINLDKDKDNIDRVTVHDETNKFLAYLLTQMKEPDFPVAIGVLHRVSKPTLDEHFIKTNNLNKNKISEIINKGQTWTIDK